MNNHWQNSIILCVDCECAANKFITKTQAEARAEPAAARRYCSSLTRVCVCVNMNIIFIYKHIYRNAGDIFCCTPTTALPHHK